MDFKSHGMGFQEADRRYAELTRQRDAGIVGDEEFDVQRQQLVVQDDQGRWWAKHGESGDWHYRADNTWVRGIPPGYQDVVTQPATAGWPAQMPSLSRPKAVKNGKNGRQSLPLWILVTGLGGIMLVGIVSIFWVLVPNLRGEPSSSEQEGGSMMSKQESETTPDGAVFDSVFVHRATPENISANSTYLDNPLANNNPNVIFYVTQNWNPEGSAGIYNAHPIGVWYDPSRQRWAIFNQDRDPMPDGAAFNVAVLEEPTEAR